MCICDQKISEVFSEVNNLPNMKQARSYFVAVYIKK